VESDTVSKPRYDLGPGQGIHFFHLEFRMPILLQPKTFLSKAMQREPYRNQTKAANKKSANWSFAGGLVRKHECSIANLQSKAIF
jgi:hypothetical protein